MHPYTEHMACSLNYGKNWALIWVGINWHSYLGAIKQPGRLDLISWAVKYELWRTGATSTVILQSGTEPYQQNKFLDAWLSTQVHTRFLLLCTGKNQVRQKHFHTGVNLSTSCSGGGKTVSSRGYDWAAEIALHLFCSVLLTDKQTK